MGSSSSFCFCNWTERPGAVFFFLSHGTAAVAIALFSVFFFLRHGTTAATVAFFSSDVDHPLHGLLLPQTRDYSIDSRPLSRVTIVKPLSFMAYSTVAFLVLAFVMLATHIDAAAIPCTQLKQRLYPCTVYLKRKSGDSGSCCNEVRKVNAELKTKVDRQTACKCILGEVHATRGLDVNLLAKLPQTCGVSIRGYIVRQNFNCNSIS